MKEAFVQFYLEGREFRRITKYLPDAAEIAQQILAGADVRTAITDACAEAVKPLASDRRKKRAWLEEVKGEVDFVRDQIPTSGLPMGITNADDFAWHCYCQGFADELAYVIEEEVLAELSGDAESEEDEEESDEDEDDNEDEPSRKGAPS